jgi:hypothetical protein
MYSTWTPLRLISPPLLTDSSRTRIPDPRAGSKHVAAVADKVLAAAYDHMDPSNVEPPTAQKAPIELRDCPTEVVTVILLPPRVLTWLGWMVEMFIGVSISSVQPDIV